MAYTKEKMTCWIADFPTLTGHTKVYLPLLRHWSGTPYVAHSHQPTASANCNCVGMKKRSQGIYSQGLSYRNQLSGSSSFVQGTANHENSTLYECGSWNLSSESVVVYEVLRTSTWIWLYVQEEELHGLYGSSFPIESTED